MNKNLVKIYTLIMLECRLSLEDASRIFQVDINKLKENLTINILGGELYEAIKYLSHEVNCYPLDNSRGLFKASIYIRRLRKILKISNEIERKTELEEFIKDLQGPDIRFALEKPLTGAKYEKEEKELILKYHLKYMLTGLEMMQIFHIHKESLIRWEQELPESELKTRLSILREYLNNKYIGARK